MAFCFDFNNTLIELWTLERLHTGSLKNTDLSLNKDSKTAVFTDGSYYVHQYLSYRDHHLGAAFSHLLSRLTINEYFERVSGYSTYRQSGSNGLSLNPFQSLMYSLTSSHNSTHPQTSDPYQESNEVHKNRTRNRNTGIRVNVKKQKGEKCGFCRSTYIIFSKKITFKGCFLIHFQSRSTEFKIQNLHDEVRALLLQQSSRLKEVMQ